MTADDCFASVEVSPTGPERFLASAVGDDGTRYALEINSDGGLEAARTHALGSPLHHWRKES